ncbi:glutathione transferase [Ranunculus cassubicifolius]
MEDKVQLYGVWFGSPSPTKRAELALKLKGIPYEFIQEDVSNKSDMLLHFNPVHKKLPVLVHNGRPIAESHIIIEYIDEVWGHAPRLVPLDPYERAKVRFWAQFFDQKISARKLVLSEGEELKKVVAEYKENQSILEEGLKRDFGGKGPFFNGETPGFLDIVIGAIACSYRAIEEIAGAKLIDPEMHPFYFSWVTAMENHPVVKTTIPPHDNLIDYICAYKAKVLQSTKA